MRRARRSGERPAREAERDECEKKPRGEEILAAVSRDQRGGATRKIVAAGGLAEIRFPRVRECAAPSTSTSAPCFASKNSGRVGARNGCPGEPEIVTSPRPGTDATSSACPISTFTDSFVTFAARTDSAKRLSSTMNAGSRSAFDCGM